MGNKTLYAELKELREELRATDRANSNICSDSVLSEISKAMPKNYNQLLAIEGVTEEFCDNYGKTFVRAINDYNKRNSVSRFKNNSNLVYTLKELEKKLVTLNKRNRLLYSNKLANKYGIDMLSLMSKQAAFDFLFAKNNAEIKLCDISGEAGQSKINISNYNKLVALLREVTKDFREKGQYDLYIAYPFLRGNRMVGDDFELNAPLVLFPVILTKETTCFNLKRDVSRDIIYNNNILLANYKFNKLNKPLPNNVIYEINENNFFAKIGEFYKNEKVDLKMPNNMDIEKYIPPTECEKLKKGELCVVNTMILGKFNTYSSSMQKDLNNIIESGSVNSLLEDLLAGMDDYDFYQENDDDYDLLKCAKEEELLYINPINSTQENVILASDNCKELVVQGPPGTGKSQVITSLIANAVSKNKSVLMVSEKKSALDVVYSRLGELSKYVLLLDDVNKKDNFYNQIDLMCKAENFNINYCDTHEIDNDIEESMKSIDTISQKMRDKSLFGIEVYKLYQVVPKWDLINQESAKNYATIANCVLPEIKKYNYNELRKVYLTLKNKQLVESLVGYMTSTIKYPQLGMFKDNISEAELLNMQNDCRKVINAKKVLSELNLSNKHCVKKALNKQAKSWLKTAINSTSQAERVDFIENTHNYMLMTDLYSNYVKCKFEYDSLIDSTKNYFNSVYNVAQKLKISIEKANDYLYSYVINSYLIAFENENRAILNKIDDYGQVLKKLSGLLENKIAITKENLHYILTKNIENITTSKRYGDIRRMIESNRRWSVAKFTDKFFVELFTAIKVWLLTPEVVSEILPLKKEMFDLVIFDEASQMYIEKGVPAIIRGKSVIIAGDSKQLRPSNLGSGRIDSNGQDDVAEIEDLIAEDCGIAALEEESLLDVARFKYPPVMLDFHYRSKYAELIAFSNYAFYGGKLNVSPNPNLPEKPPIEMVKVKGGIWENRANKAEAIKVVQNLKSILKNRQNSESIGIITFNSSQRDLIMDVIDEVSAKDKTFAKAVAKEFERKENGEDIGLFVKNIENVQGDERDIIIFSIGYAENEHGKIIKNFGWLNQRGGENRLNVAISRAKTKIIIVSSITPEDLDVENCKNKGPKILKKYLQYARAVSSGDKETANNILLSFVDKDNSENYISNKPQIAEKLKQSLEAYGYKIEENIGVGAYTIDMGVIYNGKYIMGIEFDSSLYNVNVNNRERDFHRWKYFKLRGWNIYRVWTSVWWDDYNAQLNKMILKLEKIKAALADKEGEV